ncbi:hypothetical protein M9H77_26888 [Catharanthus roseus]|uniref:Uncharacterized protein n=1 Tax=Catharanthus roseus TaxID=4058 RepID=A0ACC0ACI5_CATRO|nr:hypothetical protein M9H77_26888 [Catharanthus roseus]
MELKLGPITRSKHPWMKKLKTSNRNEDNGMVAYMEKALKNKFEEFEGQGKASKFSISQLTRIIQGNNLMVKMAKYGRKGTLPQMVPLPLLLRAMLGKFRFLMSMEGQLLTQFHQEGTNDPTRMNLNETLRSMQQSIEGLTRQFHSAATDVEELKGDKNSTLVEQRVGDNFEGINSPHHQRPYGNTSAKGYHDMLAHNPYPFHEVGFQERPQTRGGRSGVM